VAYFHPNTHQVSSNHPNTAKRKRTKYEMGIKGSEKQTNAEKELITSRSDP
jgi:hypothetical protein